jgi:hypothetical protein
MQPQLFPILAQRGATSGGEGPGVGFLLFEVVLLVAVIAGLWGIFTKAGKPGWAALIPIYNVVVLLEVVGRPIWWVILMLIPCVNIVVGIILAVDTAKAFGKGAGYAAGLIFLPFIFYPMLGFGSDPYIGPSAAA